MGIISKLERDIYDFESVMVALYVPGLYSDSLSSGSRFEDTLELDIIRSPCVMNESSFNSAR